MPKAAVSFPDRIAHLLAKVDYKRADSREQREAIYHLRYKAYLRDGAISSRLSETFSDAYDETNNAYLFGSYIDGHLTNSLRLHVVSKEHPHSPSLEVFPEYLLSKLDAGQVFIDTTVFVADEEFSKLHRALPYVTLRLCILAAESFSADDLLASVMVEHEPFYRRAFDFRLVSESRAWSPLTKPFSLMSVHFPSAAQELYRRYPFFRSALHERQRLFERNLTLPHD
jgi:N-acyl-L-homoserine lactone synthetase